MEEAMTSFSLGTERVNGVLQPCIGDSSFPGWLDLSLGLDLRTSLRIEVRALSGIHNPS